MGYFGQNNSPNISYHHSKWSKWKSKSVSRLLFSRQINSAKKSWFSNLFFFTCAPTECPFEFDLTGLIVPDVVRIERARTYGICGARPSGSLRCTWTPKSSWVFVRVCACECVCVYVYTYVPKRRVCLYINTDSIDASIISTATLKKRKKKRL